MPLPLRVVVSEGVTDTLPVAVNEAGRVRDCEEEGPCDRVTLPEGEALGEDVDDGEGTCNDEAGYPSVAGRLLLSPYAPARASRCQSARESARAWRAPIRSRMGSASVWRCCWATPMRRACLLLCRSVTALERERPRVLMWAWATWRAFVRASG